MREAALFALPLFALTLLTACDEAEPKQVAIGTPCGDQFACQSDQWCHLGICTAKCEAAEDCNGLSCGRGGRANAGVLICLPACEVQDQASWDEDLATPMLLLQPTEYACVDGVATPCLGLDETHCPRCGCEAGLACSEAGAAPACVPAADGGLPDGAMGDEDAGL